MKQFLIGISLTILGTIIISPFIPWWGIAIVAMIIGASVGLKGTTSFYYGFLGVGLVWLVTMILKNIGNNGILLERMTGLFPIESTTIMLLTIALIGGIVGGLSAATGGIFRQLINSNKSK